MNNDEPIEIEAKIYAFGTDIKMLFVISDSIVVLSTIPVDMAKRFYNAELQASRITGKAAGMCYDERRQKCYTNYFGKNRDEIFKIVSDDIKKLKEGGRKL